MKQTMTPGNSADEKKTMSDAMASAGNYHRYLWDMVSPELNDRVMEIGVGFGQYTRKMIISGKTVLGIDIDKDHLNALSSSLNSPNLALLQLNLEDTINGHAACKKFSPTSILCMNILEHVRDDAKALEFLGSIASDSCNLVLIVPSLSSIFNSLDKEAGHFRRYTLNNLSSTLEKSGWEVDKIRYINLPGILGWIIAGLVGRVGNKETTLNAPTTNLLIKLYNQVFISLSRLTDFFFGQVAGLSLFVVARKKV